MIDPQNPEDMARVRNFSVTKAPIQSQLHEAGDHTDSPTGASVPGLPTGSLQVKAKPCRD